MANPDLDEAVRADLVRRLMTARRAVRSAKQASDKKAEVAAHKAVDTVKQALGERGPVWWRDGSPDLNRHMAKNTPYADWYANIGRSRPEDPTMPKAVIFDMDGTLTDSDDLHAMA